MSHTINLCYNNEPAIAVLENIFSLFWESYETHNFVFMQYVWAVPLTLTRRESIFSLPDRPSLVHRLVFGSPGEGQGGEEEFRNFLLIILFLLEHSWFYFLYFKALGSSFIPVDRPGARGSEKT